jgi:hypothetical protein
VSDDLWRYACIAALLAAGLLGAWTAWACRRAQERGAPGSDATSWAGLALVFVLLSQTKLARVVGLANVLGQWLRFQAREHHFYAHRRPYQIAATAAVALAVLVLLVVGLLALRDHIRRYRLAIGFASLAVGLGFIRFISLHEVDAWNASMPWLRVVADLVAAAGASALAVGRLRQLGEFTRWRFEP